MNKQIPINHAKNNQTKLSMACGIDTETRGSGVARGSWKC